MDSTSSSSPLPHERDELPPYSVRDQTDVESQISIESHTDVENGHPPPFPFRMVQSQQLRVSIIMWFLLLGLSAAVNAHSGCKSDMFLAMNIAAGYYQFYVILDILRHAFPGPDVGFELLIKLTVALATGFGTKYLDYHFCPVCVSEDTVLDY